LNDEWMPKGSEAKSKNYSLPTLLILPNDNVSDRVV
jgi:hypothetical protein